MSGANLTVASTTCGGSAMTTTLLWTRSSFPFWSRAVVVMSGGQGCFSSSSDAAPLSTASTTCPRCRDSEGSAAARASVRAPVPPVMRRDPAMEPIRCGYTTASPSSP